MKGTNAEVTRDYYQPPDSVAVMRCDECGGMIYEGDKYYEITRFQGVQFAADKTVCKDCIDDVMVNEFENMSFSDRLETIGGEVRTVGG